MNEGQIKHAPWTVSEMNTLNHRQQNSSLHPYTCAYCGQTLHAKQSGWYCPIHGRVQTWAHARDAEAQL